MQGHCIGERPFYVSARPRCDVSAEASNAQPTFAWHARAPDISREEAQHGSSLRARAVPRWLWLVCAICRESTGRKAFLFRRAAVVQRASCVLQHIANFCMAHACAPLLWLSLGSRRSTRAFCARAPVVVSAYHMQGHCIGERPVYFSARPWFRRASCGLQRKADFRVVCARARYLSGGSAARKLSARACRTALVMVGLCHM